MTYKLLFVTLVIPIPITVKQCALNTVLMSNRPRSGWTRRRQHELCFVVMNCLLTTMLGVQIILKIKVKI